MNSIRKMESLKSKKSSLHDCESQKQNKSLNVSNVDKKQVQDNSDVNNNNNMSDNLER